MLVAHSQQFYLEEWCLGVALVVVVFVCVTFSADVSVFAGFSC
jgi:hypothetical protein